MKQATTDFSAINDAAVTLESAASPQTQYRHVYVHVPFCARRCSYCDFAIVVRRRVPVDEYVDAFTRELALRIPTVDVSTLDTLYFGGGTPSRLGADGIARLLRTVREYTTLSSDAEVTLEANPEDVTVDNVSAWREAGINRLSIGIQSFDDRVLRWMHRVHDADASRRAVTAARAGGIDAFSVDLIFAVPETLQRDWKSDLEQVVGLEADHVSLYGLTIEPHTPLGHWRERGEVDESPEERYETEFMQAHETLASSGYEHYEVSNFARPGRRAVHNSAYWRGVPYLGIGPSAHGYDGDIRRWNIAAYPQWEAALASGADPLAGQESLTRDNRTAEQVYLGLRTHDGLSLTSEEMAATDRWRQAGWIESVGGASDFRIRCTPLGWLRLDRLAADLTALRSHS